MKSLPEGACEYFGWVAKRRDGDSDTEETVPRAACGHAEAEMQVEFRLVGVPRSAQGGGNAQAAR